MSKTSFAYRRDNDMLQSLQLPVSAGCPMLDRLTYGEPQAQPIPSAC